LETVLEGGPPIRAGPALPELPRTVRREQIVSEKFGLGGVLKEPPDLEEIASRVRVALAGKNIEIRRRDLRYAPLCIWGVEEPIAQDPRLLRALLDWIDRVGRRSLVRALAAVYFRMFSPDRLEIELVGRALSRMVNESLRALYDLHREFRVFEPEYGPSLVAQACLSRDTMPHKILQGFGLTGQALVDGFGFAVFQEGMHGLRDSLAREPSPKLVRRIRAWTDEPGEASYRDANKTLANTLLLPFANGDPSDEIKDEILDVLLERIGDPRTRSQNWVRMPDAADIARRWLTRLALRQFLEIVDDVAFRDHWDYRRAFWMAFYEKGFIQEAWVAFGPAGAVRAHREFGRSVSFGRLTASSKQVETGHAVLLIRIGDYTIVDWSHNGRCIIWPASDPNSPKLYRATYRSGELAPPVKPNGGFEKAHHHSRSYSWQQSVADFLRIKTGLTLHTRDYRVR